MTNRDRTPVITPTHGRFPSGTLDDSLRNSSRRRNDSSIASGHRRGVSFDVLREQANERDNEVADVSTSGRIAKVQ